MYERIPAELRSLKQWGCFHRIWQPEKNKYTKIPYSALTGTKTSSTDSKQWVTFEEAITALQAYDLDGLGFFFANGYVGIDVDHIGDDLERLEEGQTDDNVAWEFMNLDYSPRYLGHEIASGRSESNVWSVANTD